MFFVIQTKAQIATQTLDINLVKTEIKHPGSYTTPGTANVFGTIEFPIGSLKTLEIASNPWFSGIDNGGQLHLAGQTYKLQGADYQPGPLNLISGTTTTNVAIGYDKIWKINKTDIADFIIHFNDGSLAAGTYTPTADILSWPGNGNTLLNYDTVVAPYIDINHDKHYNPYDGDYPDILGDQALYYIFNDYTSHSESGGLYTNKEIHAMVYGYSCPKLLIKFPALAYTVFYHYKIIERSNYSNQNSIFSLWHDVNLGGDDDDYIGCDVPRHLSYYYNSLTTDAIYGNYSPVQGIMLLKGPNADMVDGIDNDMDGCVDCTYLLDATGTPTSVVSDAILPEEIKMSGFSYDINSSVTTTTAMGSPTTAQEYRYLMAGLWRDGNALTCGGNGYGSGGPTPYAFTENTYSINCNSNWTEVNAGNTGGNRAGIINNGSMTTSAGDVNEMEFAFITVADSTTLNSPAASIQKLKQFSDSITFFYKHSNVFISNTCPLPSHILSVKELNSSMINLYPNPIRNQLYINTKDMTDRKMVYTIHDILGKTIQSGHFISLELNVIDLNDLKSGIYSIQIQTESGTISKKFIKE